MNANLELLVRFQRLHELDPEHHRLDIQSDRSQSQLLVKPQIRHNMRVDLELVELADDPVDARMVPLDQHSSVAVQWVQFLHFFHSILIFEHLLESGDVVLVLIEKGLLEGHTERGENRHNPDLADPRELEVHVLDVGVLVDPEPEAPLESQPVIGVDEGLEEDFVPAQALAPVVDPLGDRAPGDHLDPEVEKFEEESAGLEIVLDVLSFSRRLFVQQVVERIPGPHLVSTEKQFSQPSALLFVCSLRRLGHLKTLNFHEDFTPLIFRALISKAKAFTP